MNNKFQHSCIGDNTRGNREHLEKLGKTCIDDNTDHYLVTHENAFYSIPDGSVAFDSEYYINCIGNDTLFQAVTAMRDDSDMCQYFTNGDTWVLCSRHSFGDYAYIYGFKPNKWYKATLAELQEHFKLK